MPWQAPAAREMRLRRSRAYLLLDLLAALPLWLAGPALAQGRHNTAAPIDFGADHIELQDRANRAVLSGGVSVRQAEMTLNAARMRRRSNVRL